MLTSGLSTLNSAYGFIMMELTLENIADFKDQAQASFYRDEITEPEYRYIIFNLINACMISFGY